MMYLDLDSAEPVLVIDMVDDDTPATGYCPRCGAPVTLRLGITWRHDGPSCGWTLGWPPAFPAIPSLLEEE